MNLELSNLTPEIRAAIATIAALSSAPVTLRETTILETPDVALGELLRKVLAAHLVVTQPGQPTPKTAMLASATPPPGGPPTARL